MSAIDIKNPGAKNAELQGALMRLIEDEPFVSTGATAGRTLQARFGELINVLDFGAVNNADVGTVDSSAAFDAAIAKANSIYATGKIPPPIYIPRGNYYLTTQPRSFVGPGAVIGAGHYGSIIRLAPTFTGDVFQWSECWSGVGGWLGSNSLLGNPRAGPLARDFAIFGDRTATGRQHGLGFYDSNGLVMVDNVDMWFLPGTALSIGKRRDIATRAYTRESHFNNVRCFNCGFSGFPVIDVDSYNNTEGTNELHFTHLNIFSPRDIGLRITNSAAGGVVRQITIDGLRVEGDPALDFPGKDLVYIGNASIASQVNLINISNAELMAPYSSAAAIRFTANGSANASYGSRVQGFIGGGIVRSSTVGLALDAIRNAYISMDDIANVTNHFSVGPATHTTGPVDIDYPLGPQSLTVAWDASANHRSLLFTPRSTVEGQYIFRPSTTSINPLNNGEFTFQVVGNTALSFKFKGSDAVVRFVTLTLA